MGKSEHCVINGAVKMRSEQKRVVIVGSGNVATSVALGLREECELVQVYSRHIENAQALASKVGCGDATDDLRRLVADADVYVVSVTDDAIGEVVASVPDNGALWLHTSGSVPVSALAGARQRCGVMWPMQSFSKSMPVSMADVHVFVEGNNEATTAQVAEFAGMLSRNVTVADSAKRKRLHVASVFACNFANHMWTLAAEVLDESGLSFDALLPLIRTTVEKLEHLRPLESQTGPAARGDEKVMRGHMELLTGDKREIYAMLSRSIRESQRKIEDNGKNRV